MHSSTDNGVAIVDSCRGNQITRMQLTKYPSRKGGRKAQYIQMLKLIANCILLHVYQLVLVRFVGLLLIESPDYVRLVLTDIICTDLSHHFAGRITDCLDNTSHRDCFH